jgi:hypothetical protein
MVAAFLLTYFQNREYFDILVLELELPIEC